MIQNLKKVSYFQSGNCSEKLSSNPFQKIFQNAELVLRLGVIMIRDFFKDFFQGRNTPLFLKLQMIKTQNYPAQVDSYYNSS